MVGGHSKDEMMVVIYNRSLAQSEEKAVIICIIWHVAKAALS
jgi:hypothetical protein